MRTFVLLLSLLFKPSATQPISQTSYDLNNEPFNDQAGLGHLNTKLALIPIPTVLNFKF